MFCIHVVQTSTRSTELLYMYCICVMMAKRWSFRWCNRSVYFSSIVSIQQQQDAMASLWIHLLQTNRLSTTYYTCPIWVYHVLGRPTPSTDSRQIGWLLITGAYHCSPTRRLSPAENIPGRRTSSWVVEIWLANSTLSHRIKTWLFNFKPCHSTLHRIQPQSPPWTCAFSLLFFCQPTHRVKLCVSMWSK